MKKILTAIMGLVLLAGASVPTFAQTTRWREAQRVEQQRAYENSRRVYYDRRYDDRSFLDQHRDKVTVAGGTAAGAIIGALAGGKTGAIVGALIGGGGSALYTYGIRDRNNDRYYHRR